MRLLNIVSFCFAIASACFLYALNYDTRRLEGHVQAQERIAAETKSDIAVLKAERSHLSRPDRIDPLARQIGLVPPRADQLVSQEVVSVLPAKLQPQISRSASGQ